MIEQSIWNETVPNAKQYSESFSLFFHQANGRKFV